MKILIKTINGKVFKCSVCNAIHVEYKNLNFNFSDDGYDEFVAYICGIDGVEWEYRNSNSNFQRKIMIPLGNGTMNVLLNRDELEELKCMLQFRENVSEKNYKLQSYELLNIAYMN